MSDLSSPIVFERWDNRRTIPSRYLGGNSPQAQVQPPFIKNQEPGGVEVPCCVSATLTVCFETVLGTSTDELSMMFHFHNTPGRQTGGMKVSEGLNTAKQKGICRFTLHPYRAHQGNENVPPRDEAVQDAQTRLLAQEGVGYQMLSAFDLPAWVDALDRDIPILLAFYLYPTAYAQVQTAPHIHGIPDSARPTQGHAVTVVGYDSAAQQFVIQDNRGLAFADNGHWYLPVSVAASTFFTYMAVAIHQLIGSSDT